MPILKTIASAALQDMAMTGTRNGMKAIDLPDLSAVFVHFWVTYTRISDCGKCF